MIQNFCKDKKIRKSENHVHFHGFSGCNNNFQYPVSIIEIVRHCPVPRHLCYFSKIIAGTDYFLFSVIISL